MEKRIKKLKFKEFYNQIYLETGLYQEKLIEVQPENIDFPIYIRRYTHYLKNYVNLYANAKGNKQKIKKSQGEKAEKK